MKKFKSYLMKPLAQVLLPPKDRAARKHQSGQDHGETTEGVVSEAEREGEEWWEVVVRVVGE